MKKPSLRLMRLLEDLPCPRYGTEVSRFSHRKNVTTVGLTRPAWTKNASRKGQMLRHRVTVPRFMTRSFLTVFSNFGKNSIQLRRKYLYLLLLFFNVGRTEDLVCIRPQRKMRVTVEEES